MPGSAKVHDDRLGGDPGETRHALGVLLITLTIVDLEGDMNQMNKRSVLGVRLSFHLFILMRE
jgi:hypothetical protein